LHGTVFLWLEALFARRAEELCADATKCRMWKHASFWVLKVDSKSSPQTSNNRIAVM
jgi:hypothetical protein